MSLPTPTTALNDACSVIFNNTLYVYMADAFQSLELVKGAQWNTLKSGQSVTGGVCVGSTPSDSSKAGFWVVGGTSANSTYQGLQKFTYSTGSWESILFPLDNAVADQRLLHGATYINASDSIFIYAGSQDGDKGLSTQTYSIGASAPYEVLSRISSGNPPLKNPILLPWSNSQAVVLGGSTTNTAVWLFEPASGTWTNSGVTLAQGISKDITSVKAALMVGDDGSKSLYTFDSTVSPNQINRTVLIDSSGNAVTNAQVVSKRWEEEARGEYEHASRIVPRSLTEANWPAYNSSLAPTSTRSTFALATDENGQVVIAGGSTEDVLCIFNMRSNAWVDAKAALVDSSKVAAQSVSISSSVLSTATATTASSSSSVTSTAAAASSSAPAAGTAATTSSSSSSGSSTNAILAAVLGSIFGLAIILFFVYWCVRRQRAQGVRHPESDMDGRTSAGSMEKGAMEYAGDTFPQPPTFRGHQQQDSHASFSSMAILMGKVHQSKPSQSSVPKTTAMGGIKRTSTDSIFNKAFKNTISKPIPQRAEIVDARSLGPSALRDEKGVSFAPDTTDPKPRNNNAGLDREDSTRRSSGWNRYWSGGSALNMLGFGNGGNHNSANGPHPGKRITVESDASSYGDPYRITQDSATVPPLNVYEPRASFSRVNSGSPTIAQFNPKVPLQQGMSGHIERPVSANSDTQSAYSSGIPASVHETWDPTAMNNDMGTAADWAAGRGRAASSFYSTSVYTTALAPASNSRPPTQQVPTGFPSGLSKQPQLAVAATSSDMSWLNLGGDTKNDRGI